MRILFLSKRRYMSKDVIDDRYGRLYELPANLARQGHSVLGLCTAYRRLGDRRIHHHGEQGDLNWQPFDLLPHGASYAWRLPALGRTFAPDLVFSASDALQVVLGNHLARRLDVPHAVDLYDNFESFGLTRLPGLRRAFRRALQRASAISCVSEPLQKKLACELPEVPLLTLESTIDPDAHRPFDRGKAREHLGLPADAWLMGTAGALHHNRDIGLLYAAFERLATRHPDLHLALAGPVDPACPLPQHPRVHYLNQLPHAQVPLFHSALDLALICMCDSEFGRYAFPQKTYEILACGTPLLAASVDAPRSLLADWPRCLYRPGDLDQLITRIEEQRQQPCTPSLAIPSWADQAKRLESFWREHLELPE
ncbi:glycosyltransferase [endosymbiont of unidentified scaly snail isolate Monju]|uniref:glycosyltransferase n=1 Tax=endosymbiont of unidentified scaly snail isolate Monju TaxID=1248727 RepID=UPI0003891E91|nr:glycosyltransferase [endosymbiont of unidentified scaly snail isolate Monju]BAN69956.1 glycosyl transferase group 1 [endosymbiont of unidentified scaly snail isolate Monju]